MDVLALPFDWTAQWWVLLVAGVTCGFVRHVYSNRGVRFPRRDGDLWGLGVLEDLLFSTLAAGVNVLGLHAAGTTHLALGQVLWASVLAGLAGPAFLAKLIDERSERELASDDRTPG